MKRVVIRVAIDDIADETAIGIKQAIERVLEQVPEARVDLSITTVPDRPA